MCQRTPGDNKFTTKNCVTCLILQLLLRALDKYIKYYVLLIAHSHGIVQECCKGDDASQRGNWKFDPLPRPNPLTDHHQTLRT